MKVAAVLASALQQLRFVLSWATCNEDAFRVRGLLRHRCLLLALLVSVRPVLVPSIWCYAVLELTVVSRALIIRV